MDVPDMFCKLRFVGQVIAYAGSVYKVVDKKAKV
jgi:hypothetical protein